MPVDFERDDEFGSAFRPIQGSPAERTEVKESGYSTSKTNVQRITDYTSISIAGFCIVHCLMIPVLLVLFPVLGSVLLFEEILHELLLLLIIPSSLLAIFLGCRRHRDLAVFLIVVLGLALIVTGIVGVEESKETVLVLTGSVIMVIGHIRNFRLCSKTACKH